jgi:hypothetical protein
MFGAETNASRKTRRSTVTNKNDAIESNAQIRSELKIGKLVQLVLRPLLQSDKVSKEEIVLLQEKEYSKKHFDIQYPLLIKTTAEDKELHYYKERFYINGESYRLCREWFETEANNDRPYLERWIIKHDE